jgi:DNA polymerase III beta subunit
MNVRINSADMNRMMKIVNQCVDTLHENVEVIYDNNLLTVRGTNGFISAVISTPILGGDGSSFCVDGEMPTRVCAMCKGEIELSADGNVCTVKGAGRTRLPIVKARVAAFEPVKGQSMTVKGSAMNTCYGKVSYAVSTNQARVTLTGVKLNADGEQMKMAALDGFQLAVEYTECTGDEISILIPGAFMNVVTKSILPDDDVKITTDGKRVQITTDELMMNCALLTGEFPDYEALLPDGYCTEVLVKVDDFAAALKSSSAVQNKTSAVRLEVGNGIIKVRNNSEHAEYEADVQCDIQGEDLRTAYNEKYMMSALNMIDGDEAVVKFGGGYKPTIVQEKGNEGYHLLLPVRVHEV